MVGTCITDITGKYVLHELFCIGFTSFSSDLFWSHHSRLYQYLSGELVQGYF